MTWRSGSSDGTFYFQAWHVAKVVSGESWVQNKGIADFVEQNISPETKKWLYIKGCVPTKEKPGLLVPYSICAKVRTPKSGQNPKDAEQALLHFRNEEFPSIAKTYFATKLNKSLDFFNSFSEGAEFETPLANFDTVKSSKKLRERVKSAIKFVKKDFWGDIVHGLVDGVSKKDGHFSPKSEFKATRFIKRRGKDPASNPNILPATPLQNPLPLPDNGFARVQEPVQGPDLSPRPRKTSDVTVASTDAPGTDASSVGSVETAQSSVVIEESSSSELQDVKESSSEPQDANKSSSVVAEDSSSSEVQDAKETSSELQDTKESSSELLNTEESSSELLNTEESSSELQDESSSELQDAKETSSELLDAEESSSESQDTNESSSESQDANKSSVVAEDSSSSDLLDAEESSPELQDTNESSSKLQDAEESSSESQDAKETSSELQDAEESFSESQDAKEPSSESSIALEEEEASTSPADEDAPNTTAANDSTTDAEVDASADVTAADSSEASYQETTTEPTTNATNGPAAMTAPSSSVIATRRKMNSVSSQGAQTAYFVVQNSGNWLRYLMANQGQSAQKLRSTFFDSPIILAAPVQALGPDGMMRIYFMSQAKKQQDEVVCDEKGRAIRTRKGSKSVREWVVGTAKIPSHALTMHLGKQLENRNARLLPAAPPAVRKVDSVVGPNNRLIEMTDAPGIPQAILVTTPHPVEDVREGDIVQEERDDGFVHIETNIINRRVEEVVSDNVDDTDKKAKGERKVNKADKKPRSKGKLPSRKNKSKTTKTTKVDQLTDTNTDTRADVKTDIAVDANGVPPRKPSKVYTPPFSRKSWRDVEPQEPQVIYDTMSGYNFLQVEDVQIFSFSTSSHDMMLRTTPVPAAVEDGEGIDVWSPPVVGIFSWMWDYLAPKATAAH